MSVYFDIEMALANAEACVASVQARKSARSERVRAAKRANALRMDEEVRRDFDLLNSGRAVIADLDKYNYSEPDECVELSHSDGPVGAFARLAENLFVTAHHVVEDEVKYAADQFPLKVGGVDVVACATKIDEEADLVFFRVDDTSGIKAPIHKQDSAVRDLSGYVLTRRGRVNIKLRFFQDDYFVCDNNPLNEGCSGLGVITPNGVSAIYVGCQPGNVGVFRALPFEFDTAIMELDMKMAPMDYSSYECHGRKRRQLYKRMKADAFSDEAYDAAVSRVIARFGYIDSREVAKEMYIEREFQEKFENEAFSVDEESAYSNDYYSDDFGIEEGDFDDNDRASVERENRKAWREGGFHRSVGYKKHSTRGGVRLGDLYVPSASSFLDGDVGPAVAAAEEVETRSVTTSDLASTPPCIDTPAPPAPVEEEKKADEPTRTETVPEVSEVERLRAEMAELKRLISAGVPAPAPSATEDLAKQVIKAKITHKQMADARFNEDYAELKAKFDSLSQEGFLLDKPVELPPHVTIGKTKRDLELLQLRKEVQYLESKKKFFEMKRAERQQMHEKMVRVNGLLISKTAELEDVRRKFEDLQSKLGGSSGNKEDFSKEPSQ